MVNAGLPVSSVEEFVTDFLDGNSSALTTIAGVTPSVIKAAEHGLEKVTAESFKFVWIANAVIAVVTVMRKYTLYILISALSLFSIGRMT